MSAELMTVLAAVIAAFASLFTVVLTRNGAISLDARKFDQTQRAEADKSLRLALAEVGAEMSQDVQRVVLFAWNAKHDPGGPTSIDIAEYEKASSAALSRLFRAQVLLAANDRATYDIIAPLIRSFHETDDCVTKALITLKRDRQQGIAAVAACHAQGIVLYDSMPEAFANGPGPGNSPVRRSIHCP
ncbi:hypothetical protein [Caballeronia cordobensis]|uniref:hypothetical protein n=1 Tax=Caballeronia cordobensis TaxID=1353886 RepID=UPI001F422EE2|nr:hypothetical protein [Caballeronia cordobensis]